MPTPEIHKPDCTIRYYNPTTQTGTIPTGTTAAALYTAGDIVMNPASAASSHGWVIRYDPASDTYERALSTKMLTAAGDTVRTTGPRPASRSVMDKTYTEKIHNQGSLFVSLCDPHHNYDVETHRQPRPSTVTTATTTDTSKQKPYVERIFRTPGIPDNGRDYGPGARTSAGATVFLSHNSSSNIDATDVKVLTPKSITCSCHPDDAQVGPGT